MFCVPLGPCPTKPGYRIADVPNPNPKAHRHLDIVRPPNHPLNKTHNIRVGPLNCSTEMLQLRPEFHSFNFKISNISARSSNKTQIGADCLLMAYVHIAHDCVIGNNCILANGVTLAGHITIDDFAIIGGLSAIHQFVHIGGHVMISGGSLVRKDVPPYTKSAHEPLAYVGINSVGLRRRNFSPGDISLIQEIYRILFQKGYTLNKAVAAIESEVPPHQVRQEILQFIKSSSRGIMKGYAGNQEDE